VNADGAQELFIYFLTRQGRVETTNYRTVRLPEAQEIPLYVKDKFGDFYRDMFAQQVKRENERGVFPGVCLGHELVRPLARRILSQPKNYGAWRILARHQRRMGKGMRWRRTCF